MKGVNKVILIGTLGANPIAKHFNNGSGYAQFSIATSERWQDKQTGEWRENTEWHRIVVHGRLAEIACQYLKKGSKVYIEGSLHTRKWTDQSRQDHYITEIKANTFQSLDSAPIANPV